MFLTFNSHVPQRDTLSTDSPCTTRIVRDATTGLPRREVRLYNAVGSALVAGRPYVVRYDGDEETNPNVITPVSGTLQVDRVVIAMEAVATTSWGWFCIEGYCNALVEGTTDVAKDDFLKIKVGTTAVGVIKDGTALTDRSVGISTAAQAADAVVSTLIFLIGERVICDQ